MLIFLVQDHRVEIIKDLAKAVEMLLLEYYRKTKAKPVSIVFYRDGVSEGQFLQVC